MNKIDSILAERKSTHGEFRDHARVTWNIKRAMEMETARWFALSDIQREALCIIAHKIGRIMSGNPDFHDHWNDIAGYAKLVSDRIPPVMTGGVPNAVIGSQQSVEPQDHGEITHNTPVTLSPPDPRQFRQDHRYEDGLTPLCYMELQTPYMCCATIDRTRAQEGSQTFYVYSAIVDRTAVQNDCSYLPRLQMEMNNKEYENLPVYYQWMYDWADEKWKLRSNYHEHWGRV